MWTCAAPQTTDNELYSGTVADFSGSDPIIYREPLQTEQYDSLSLNGKFFDSYIFSAVNGRLYFVTDAPFSLCEEIAKKKI